MLVYPGNPEFDYWMSQPPAFWRHKADQVGSTVAYVADSDSGLLRPVGAQDLIEYLEGGEYDDRQSKIEGS